MAAMFAFNGNISPKTVKGIEKSRDAALRAIGHVYRDGKLFLVGLLANRATSRGFVVVGAGMKV
jgi:hypothetical protein